MHNGCKISKYIGQALCMSVYVFVSVFVCQLVSLCECDCEFTCMDVKGVQPLG